MAPQGQGDQIGSTLRAKLGPIFKLIFLMDFGLLFEGLTLLPGTLRRLEGDCKETGRITFLLPNPSRAAL